MFLLVEQRDREAQASRDKWVRIFEQRERDEQVRRDKTEERFQRILDEKDTLLKELLVRSGMTKCQAFIHVNLVEKVWSPYLRKTDQP